MMRPTHLFAICLIFSNALFCSKPFSSAADPGKRTGAEARSDFVKADKALNETYDLARKNLSKYQFDQLRADQRVWLEFREELALTPSYSGIPDHPDGDADTAADLALAKRSPEYLGALVEITNERIAWIKSNWIEKTEESADLGPLTGVWRDRQGGLMQLVEQGDKLHFIINVVRTSAAHVGGIAGIAEWNHPIGWFSDKGRDPEKADVTNLAFTWRDRKGLELIGAKTEQYHGRRAWFDGNYMQVGRLSDAETARVLQAAKSGAIPEEPSEPAPETNNLQ